MIRLQYVEENAIHNSSLPFPNRSVFGTKKTKVTNAGLGRVAGGYAIDKISYSTTNIFFIHYRNLLL